MTENNNRKPLNSPDNGHCAILQSWRLGFREGSVFRVLTDIPFFSRTEGVFFPFLLWECANLTLCALCQSCNVICTHAGCNGLLLLLVKLPIGSVEGSI